MSFSRSVQLFLTLALGSAPVAVHGTDTAYGAMQSARAEIPVSWLETVEKWGSRRTGSDAHRRCIRWLAAEFASLGLDVHRDPHEFSRFEESGENVSLSVGSGSGEKRIDLSAVYPFSGFTGVAGAAGNLALVSGRWYGKAKGKIAVVEVPNKAIPTDALFGIDREYPAGSTVLPRSIRNPVLSSTLFGPDLDRFRKAGALAVIAVWKNMSPGMAAGQYVPFTMPFHSIPAVWAAGKKGKEIVAAARNNSPAKLTLRGTLDTVSVNTLWTVIEGERTNETVLVITHTDGTNPVEENGFLGQLAIAKKIVSSGKKPQRTVVFVAVAGHLRLSDITRRDKEQATTVWLRDHHEFWDGKNGGRKAVAGMVIEHLGAMEWADTGNEYQPTGRPEIEIVYATSEKMRELVDRRWRKRRAPFRSSMVTPRSIRHLGEGEPLFEAGIPAVAFLGIPSYLLSEARDRPPGITRTQVSTLVDPFLLNDQCTGLYDILQDILSLPADRLGKVNHVGFFGRLCDLMKVMRTLVARE